MNEKPIKPSEKTLNVGTYQTAQITQEQINQKADAVAAKSRARETGTPGEMLVSTYFNQETRVDTLTLTDYRRMKDNDGEVQMIFNAIYNSIISAGFKIMDDNEYLKSQENSEDPEDSEEKKFIEGNLTNPRWKLGMSKSMEITNRTSLRAIEEGHITYEVIYRLDDDGKVRLDKLAPRIAKTNDFDLKIITDNHGEFFGFHQNSYFKSNDVDVIVINESELNKAINIVYGAEYGSNYGRPATKPVFYHYDKLHKALYTMHVGLELGTVKLRSVKKLGGGASSPDDDALMNILEKVGLSSVIMYDGIKYEVVFEDVTDAGVMAQGMEIVRYHTAQMAKALLAQFIEMGTNGNAGNRSLGDTGKTFFKDGLQAMARLLIDEPWNKVIADLIKINFNKNIYPTLVTNPISDDSIEILYQAFQGLVTKGTIPESVQAGIMEKAGEKLGLEVDEEEIMAEMQEQKKLDQENKMQEFEMQNKMMQQNKAASGQPKSSKFPIKKKTNLADYPDEYSVETTVDATSQRPLYPDEYKVRMVDIKRKLDTTRAVAEQVLTMKLQMQKNKVVNQYITAIKSGSKILPEIEIELADEQQQNKYSDELVTIGYDLLEFGKTTAANELNKPVPNTTKIDRQRLLNKVRRTLKKQETDLEFRLQNVAQRALDTNIPENDARLQLDNEYTNFVNVTVSPTLLAYLPESLNDGRQISFDKYSDDIYAYRYAAVLDTRTTDYCRELDGRVFQSNDPNYAMVTPPNHYGCRSIWVPVTKKEAADYDISVDGKPNGLPTYSSINTFRDTELGEGDYIGKKQKIEEVLKEMKEIKELKKIEINKTLDAELENLILQVKED